MLVLYSQLGTLRWSVLIRPVLKEGCRGALRTVLQADADSFAG